MDKIIDLLARNFAPILNELWNSLLFWRAIALLLILFLIMTWRFRKLLLGMLMNDKDKDYDSQIFMRSEELLTERQVRDFLDRLEADHCFFVGSASQIDRWQYFWSEIGNQFRNRNLHRNSQVAATKWGQLGDFLAQHTWNYPQSQPAGNLRNCLHPELNVDREGSGATEEINRYELYAQELLQYTREFRKSYLSYRRAVKTILEI